MPFHPGQSGNRAGRPPGSRNKVNRAMEPAFNANGEAIIGSVIEHAMAANPVAMRLCMERLVPLGRHRPVGFQLPPMHNPADVRAAVTDIHQALGDGDITIGEAADLLRVAEITARVLREVSDEPADLASRLARYEAALARCADMLGLDPDVLLAPVGGTDAPPAAGEQSIANNNAETMPAAEAVPDTAHAIEADATPEREAAVANNNVETMAPADAAPIALPDLAGNNENTPGSSDEPAVERLRVASG
jgi:hypothetical protein